MYYIIICEKATGIILELDGKTRFIKTDTNTRPSISFDNISEAEDKAHILVMENDNLEIGIYDATWSFIKRVIKN